MVSEESTEKEDLCCPLGLSLLQRQGMAGVRAGMDGVPTLPGMRPGGRTVTWQHRCPCAKDHLGDAGSQGAESAGSWAPGWRGFKCGTWRVTSECGEGWLGWGLEKVLSCSGAQEQGWAPSLGILAAYGGSGLVLLCEARQRLALGLACVHWGGPGSDGEEHEAARPGSSQP